VRVLKQVKREYISKPLHLSYAIPYFAMHLVMLDLFELWWAII
jgi:hypothetical protein